MTFDPNCFSYSLEMIYDPSISNESRETQVYSYETPWVTYQVTFNGRELVARAGMGEWTRKFGRHHEEIIAHYALGAPQGGDGVVNTYQPDTTCRSYFEGHAEGIEGRPKRFGRGVNYNAGWAVGNADRVALMERALHAH